MQGPNTHTPTKFQGHSPIITPFTPHMCGIQGHWTENVNYLSIMTTLECNSVEINDIYIM